MNFSEKNIELNIDLNSFGLDSMFNLIDKYVEDPDYKILVSSKRG